MDSSALTRSVWNVEPSAFPESGSIESQIEFLLRYAILAPSSYNTQPWEFSIDGDTVEIGVAEDRWLSVADRDKRELHISLGCALENLCIAGERFGFDYQAQYRVSRSLDSSILVTLDPDSDVRTSRPDGLFERLTDRCTTRKLFADRPLETGVVDRLQDCLVSPDVNLHLIENPEIPGSFEGFSKGIDKKIHLHDVGPTIESLRDLQASTDERLLADRDYREELAQWVGNGALGGWWPKRAVEQYVMTRYDFSEREGQANAERIDSTPVIAVLATDSDDATRRVRAGQVFERMALVAADDGVAVHPLSQTLERPDTRHRVGNLLELDEYTPQHLFRLGYVEGDSSHTPRLPVDAVLADGG